MLDPGSWLKANTMRQSIEGETRESVIVKYSIKSVGFTNLESRIPNPAFLRPRKAFSHGITTVIQFVLVILAYFFYIIKLAEMCLRIDEKDKMAEALKSMSVQRFSEKLP
jgi:large-conductance mechanosensitive channel